MSLRYALLALLTARPMTGYDLAKSFHVSVGHVWHAPDSQIYPELKRMLADGLVEGESVP
ncbi:PadR family transcriptional regulator, partial [Salmonella enterica subsp. enterica]|nr:PadR family transcriptional regulator [Salmonella enterica subsp. enterica]